MRQDSKQSHILIVDDEQDITDLIEEVLVQEGFSNIHKAYTGTQALTLCHTYAINLVILDVMLPDLSGLEVCQEIRRFSYCPILFLSARNDELDKILGLSSGGDDYITKPFSPRELMFRVQAQLRRQQYQKYALEAENTLQIGDIIIDQEAGSVKKAGVLVDLTAKEVQLLAFMAQHAGKILSKEQLYEAVWGAYSSICDNTIMVHIRHLREKLEEDASKPEIIITIRGLGYKLVKR